ADTPEPPKLSDNLHDYRDFLDFNFQQDERDRGWEVTAERKLHEMLPKFESQAIHVNSVECHASLCKVILRGEDSENMTNAKVSLLHSQIWEGQMMVVDAADSRPNDLRVVAFFARPERPLPDI